MTLKESFRKYRNTYFLLIWVLYVVYIYLLQILENDCKNNPEFLPDIVFKYSISLLLFLVLIKFVLKRFYKKPFLLILNLVIALFILSLIRFSVFKYGFPLFLKEYEYEYSYWRSFASSSWWWVQYTILAFAYHIFITKVNLEKALRESQQNKYGLGTENLKLEYKFLRAQINPHFLYNTLGFFYGKVREQDVNAGRGIELLTAMMRYSIREEGADDKVTLAEELEAIKNLLEIEQLRFGNTAYMEEKIALDMGHLRIVPHLLVTIVENACKHGDLTDKEYPLQISAAIRDGWFVFEVRNKLRTSKVREVSSGKGLVNLVERMKLQYQDQQQYTCGAADGQYTVVFKLRVEQMKEDG